MSNIQHNSEFSNMESQPDALLSPNDSSTATDAVAPNEIATLLPAFAIGALDAEENRLVQGYLLEHPELNVELADYLRLSDALLYSAELTEAPATIAHRLHTLIQAQATVEVQEQMPTAVSDRSQPQAETKIRWWQIFAKWGSTPRWAAGFAMLALVVAATFYTLRQIDAVRQSQLELQAQIDRQNTAFSVLAMDDMQRIEILVGTGAEAMEAAIVWGKGFDVALLYVENFPQSTPNKVYRLWLTQNEEQTSMGLFIVNKLGSGSLLIDLPHPFEHFDGLSITPELTPKPTLDSQVSTSAPIISGKFIDAQHHSE